MCDLVKTHNAEILYGINDLRFLLLFFSFLFSLWECYSSWVHNTRCRCQPPLWSLISGATTPLALPLSDDPTTALPFPAHFSVVFPISATKRPGKISHTCWYSFFSFLFNLWECYSSLVHNTRCRCQPPLWSLISGAPTPLALPLSDDPTTALPFPAHFSVVFPISATKRPGKIWHTCWQTQLPRFHQTRHPLCR